MSLIADVLPVQEPCSSTSSAVLSSLSVDFISVASNCDLQNSLVQNIWDKASRLVNTKGAMAPAPGHPPEARTVQSTSKTGFHLVTPGSNGKFNCDCANYHSLSLCSHAVAVAEINGRLAQFVEWHRKSKKSTSFTKLLMKDVPKGYGRKGGKAPPRKKKVEPVMKRVKLTPISPHAGTESNLHCTPEMTSTTPSLLHTTVSNCDYHITNVQTASHSQLINPVSFDAPMNPSLPSHHSLFSSMPFVPWYNSSYNSNGSQMMQQFVSPPTFASPLPTFASPPPTFSSPPHTFASPPHTFASPPHTFASPPPTFASPPHTFASPPHTFASPPHTFASPPHTFASPPHTFASPPYTFASPPHTFASPPYTFASPPHTFASPPPKFASPAQKFYIKFIVGNISVCYGCRNRYSKSPMPPDDICLQTEEWRQFTPADSLVPQTRWSNTYYHVSVNCVRHKWPMFDPKQVIVEESIQAHLVDSHREKILNELGLRC